MIIKKIVWKYKKTLNVGSDFLVWRVIESFHCAKKYENTELSPVNLIKTNIPCKKISLPPIISLITFCEKIKIIIILESRRIMFYPGVLAFVNKWDFWMAKHVFL